jgi:hypothetical protein
MKTPAIIPPSIPDAERVRTFLVETGYTVENVLRALGTEDLPSPRDPGAFGLINRASERNRLNALLRWFYFGVTFSVADVKGLIPDWFVEVALGCKILRKDGNDLTPTVLLVPFGTRWIACDQNTRYEAAEPDFVLWPNATSRLLLCFTVTRPSRATLDLGTGNGVQALSVAGQSETVVATDLNSRALDFVLFNARLNGVENIEVAEGDSFQPVKGESFDLIVSNPPFFIGPSSDFLFCDNPMDLDNLCRQLAKDGPAHLAEGGFFQMLCEWAEVEGQPWQARLTEWFEGSGCDVWVVKGQTRSAEQYAMDRLRERSVTPALDAAEHQKYKNYFESREVKAIHNGVVAMRRRAGQNWLVIEDAARFVETPFGDLVLAQFRTQDFLHANPTDEQMLAIRPAFMPHVRLEQVLRPGDEGWQSASISLKQVRGIPASFNLEAPVAEFITGFDGKQTLAELIERLAARSDAPREKVERDCVGLTRKLMAHGFLRWE